MVKELKCKIYVLLCFITLKIYKYKYNINIEYKKYRNTILCKTLQAEFKNLKINKKLLKILD